MLAINGYYDGTNYVAQENIAIKPNQKVIITVLDDFLPVRRKKSLSEIESYMNASSKSVPDGISAVDYVRRLRED
ncbi:MAG: hypothetical protein J6X11_00575 [Treponema sp.]|nr:hypothetical protein [Treponema sp.]MBP5748409.1 hypothetical protein [Treponema sp.]